MSMHQVIYLITTFILNVAKKINHLMSMHQVIYLRIMFFMIIEFLLLWEQGHRASRPQFHTLCPSVPRALTWGFGYLFKNKPSALTLGVKQISANVGGEIFGALLSTANIDSGLIIRRAFRTISERINLERSANNRLLDWDTRHAPMHWFTDRGAFVSLNYLIDPSPYVTCFGVCIQKMRLDYSLHHCLDLVTPSDRSQEKNVAGGC